MVDTEILINPETQNLAINTAPNFSYCPAKCRKTQKCYSTAWFLAKAGKAQECVRPCAFDSQIEEWNKKNGKG